MLETSATKAKDGLWDAIVHIFEDKLGRVEHELGLYLDLMAHDDDMSKQEERTESIHDLRVASRRAKAALDAFKPCVEDMNGYHRLRRHLKTIRQAVGRARDWDIYLGKTLAFVPSVAQAIPGMRFLQGYAMGQQIAAHQHGSHLRQKDLRRLRRHGQRFINHLQRHARKHATPSLTEFGQHALQEQQESLRQAAIRYEAARSEKSGKSPEYLHAVRIATKHLRYTAEIFASAVSAEQYDGFCDMLAKLQSVLGDAQDARVAADKTATLRDKLHEQESEAQLPDMETGVSAFLRSQTESYAEKEEAFAKTWQQWQQSYGEERTLH